MKNNEFEQYRDKILTDIRNTLPGNDLRAFQGALIGILSTTDNRYTFTGPQVASLLGMMLTGGKL